MTDRVAIEVPPTVARILMDRATVAQIVRALRYAHGVRSAWESHGVDLYEVASAFVSLGGEA